MQDLSATLVMWMVAMLFVSISTAIHDDDNDDWNSYKMQYNKNYDSPESELLRQMNRQRTLEMIEKYNRDAVANGSSSTYYLRENILCDLSDDEYASMLGYRSDKSFTLQSGSSSRRRRSSWMGGKIYYNTVNVTTLPSCVDWTVTGWVGPVLYQGHCSSCWSYTAVGSIQAQYYNVSGHFVQLSTQNLVDCSYPQGVNTIHYNVYFTYLWMARSAGEAFVRPNNKVFMNSDGNQGCKGGNMQRAYVYVAKNGIQLLSDYPDTSKTTGRNGTCRYNASLSVTTIETYRDVDDGNELALQQAVALVGPVSAGVDASSKKFQTYGGGVYNDPACGSGARQLNHAVLVVGYGVYNGQPYWLLQNSWGTSWGIKGYMMLARNANNSCGIATDATFPIIGQTSTSSDKNATRFLDCS